MSLFSQLSGQVHNTTSDLIVRTDGTLVNCRILHIDSTKIDLIVERNDQEVKSFILLETISSYTYKGNYVFLREAENLPEETDKLEIDVFEKKDYSQRKIDAFNKRPEWKKPGYSLHVDDQPEIVVRLSLIAPGLMFEKKLTPKATIFGHLWSGLYFEWSESYSNLFLTPSFTFGPRFYTNLEQRAFMGRRVDYFSGTYFSFPNTLVLTANGVFYQAAAVYGFQRTLGKKAYWNINLGGGLNILHGYVMPTFVSDLTLGFILSR